jgi:hypothetical protein
MRPLIATTMGAALVLLALLGACKKEETGPDTVKDTSAKQEPAPAAPAPAASSAAASLDGGASTPVVPTPAGSGTLTKGPGLDSCCSALRSNASSATGPQKARATQAAALCQSISTLVKDGKTSRAGALTQLRSAAGGTLPGACR